MYIDDVERMIRNDETGRFLRSAAYVAAYQRRDGAHDLFLNAIEPIINVVGEEEALRLVDEVAANRWPPPADDDVPDTGIACMWCHTKRGEPCTSPTCGTWND